MTKIRPLVILLLLTLLAVPVIAEDTNAAPVMTPEQLQQILEELREAQPVQQSQQPQVVTAQIDDSLRQTLELLKTEISAIKESNKRMEDRFNRLVSDTEQTIAASEKRTISQTTANVILEVQRMFEMQEDRFKDFVDWKTNPIRMNLPIVGVFAMCTAAFLLWASRQYRLTEGLRKPKELEKPGGEKHGRKK